MTVTKTITVSIQSSALPASNAVCLSPVDALGTATDFVGFTVVMQGAAGVEHLLFSAVPCGAGSTSVTSSSTYSSTTNITRSLSAFAPGASSTTLDKTVKISKTVTINVQVAGPVSTASGGSAPSVTSITVSLAQLLQLAGLDNLSNVASDTLYTISYNSATGTFTITPSTASAGTTPPPAVTTTAAHVATASDSSSAPTAPAAASVPSATTSTTADPPAILAAPATDSADSPRAASGSGGDLAFTGAEILDLLLAGLVLVLAGTCLFLLRARRSTQAR